MSLLGKGISNDNTRDVFFGTAVESGKKIEVLLLRTIFSGSSLSNEVSPLLYFSADIFGQVGTVPCWDYSLLLFHMICSIYAVVIESILSLMR